MKNGKLKKRPSDPLDDVVSVDSLRYVDTGRYFKKKAAEHRYVQLDKDVHVEFPSAKEVNDALRELLRFRTAISGLGHKRKKSA